MLALPAELRNAIYEEVLPQNTDIVVYKRLRVPPLLQVCRQVRGEAAGMWFESNRFLHDVKHCDASLLIAWDRCCSALGMFNSEHAITIRGYADWNNLMQWCKACCNDGCTFLDDTGNNRLKISSVVSAATKIAARSYKNWQSWKECKVVLAELRAAVGRYEEPWLR